MSISKSLPEGDEGEMAFTAVYQNMSARHHQAVQKGVRNEKGAESAKKSVFNEVMALGQNPSAKRAPDRLTSLLPPVNFGAVIPSGVYRSSFPLPENFSFLKSLKLKTILTLVPEPFPNSYVQFMETNGIRQVVVPVPANKEVVCIETATILKALGVVLDRSNYPLLIHCNKGKHRTGCLVACLRKIQGEGLGFALHEYHTYAGSKARSLDEVFIKGFDERTLLWLARENGFLPIDEPIIDAAGLPALKLPSRTRG